MFFITFVKPPIILRFSVNFLIVFLVSSFYDPYAYFWRKDFFKLTTEMDNLNDQLVAGEWRESVVCHLRTNVTVGTNDVQINVEYLKNKKS